MESSKPKPSVPDSSRTAIDRGKKQHRRWLWGLLSLILLTGGIGGGFALWRTWESNRSDAVANSAQQPPGVPVTLQTLEVSTLEESSEFIGSLEAQQRVALRTETEGRLVEILVRSGERVSQGTPIAQLRPDRNRAEVNGAIADLNASRAAQERAQAELLARQAERNQAQAEVELQQEEYRRVSFLVAQGALAQQNLDRVERDYNAAQAALEAAEKRVQVAIAALEEANAALARAEADVEVAREDLEDYRIVAPIAGVIGDFPVKTGDYLAVGDPVTSITQNQNLELRLPIPIEDAPQLRIGLPVELVSQSGETIAQGQISFISPQVDSNAQAVLAKATFPNPGDRLRDRQFVRARVIWQERSGLLIPTTAVTRLGGQTFVFVAEASSSATSDTGEPQLIARQKPVKLGAIQGNSYQVLEGVEPGETLITSGLLNLTDEAPIIPQSENAAVNSSSDLIRN